LSALCMLLMQRGSEDIAPVILNLCTKCRWVVVNRLGRFNPVKILPPYPLNRRLTVAGTWSRFFQFVCKSQYGLYRNIRQWNDLRLLNWHKYFCRFLDSMFRHVSRSVTFTEKESDIVTYEIWFVHSDADSSLGFTVQTKRPTVSG
jgi:hypothetical protein